MEAALSVIRNHILDPALRAKYPDYTAYRTHIIKSTKSLGGVKVHDIRYMDINQLKGYVEIHELPVDLLTFTAVQELREAIMMCKDDPERFAKWSKSIIEEKSSMRLLAELNPGVNLSEGDEDEESTDRIESKEEESGKEDKDFNIG